MSTSDRTILSVTDANKSPQKSFSSDTTSSFTDPMESTSNTMHPTVENQKPKTMEYHRQVLKGKLEDDSVANKYVSPSDNIMSPCTQKLSALKGKQFGKAKPKSLFAQTAGKNAGSGNDNDNPFAGSGEREGGNA